MPTQFWLNLQSHYEVRKLTGTTYPAANKLISRLSTCGIIAEITGNERNRLFRYEARSTCLAKTHQRHNPLKQPTKHAPNDRRPATAPHTMSQFGITSHIGEWINQVGFAHLQRQVKAV